MQWWTNFVCCNILFHHKLRDIHLLDWWVISDVDQYCRLLTYKANFHQESHQWKNTAHLLKVFMTNPCYFILFFVATHILLSQAKPTRPGAEEQELFSQSVEQTLKSFSKRSTPNSQGSLIETKLTSLKTDRSSEAETASLQALATRNNSGLDDQTLSDAKNLAKYLSRQILHDWSLGGHKFLAPIQLKTVKASYSHLIRVVRSRKIKTKNWKKFGRVALDHLALRLMRKRGTQVKNKAWKKFGRNGLNNLTTRLVKKGGRRRREGIDEMALRLMKKRSGLKNRDWKKIGRLGLDQLGMRLMRWDMCVFLTQSNCAQKTDKCLKIERNKKTQKHHGQICLSLWSKCLEILLTFKAYKMSVIQE